MIVRKKEENITFTYAYHINGLVSSNELEPFVNFLVSWFLHKGVHNPFTLWS